MVDMDAIRKRYGLGPAPKAEPPLADAVQEAEAQRRWDIAQRFRIGGSLAHFRAVVVTEHDAAQAAQEQAE